MPSERTDDYRAPARGTEEDPVLTAVSRAFRTPDLRKKQHLTLHKMAIIRLG